MNKLISNSPVPLYYQLREIIRDRITSGEYKYGDELPSELRLCDEYNICRATVKQALDGLVNDGMIVRQKGKGTFVVYEKISNNFLIEPTLMTSETPNNNYSIVLMAEMMTPNSKLKKILKIENEDELYFQLKRLHFVNDIPVALDIHYIKNKFIGEILSEPLEKLAVYKYIENYFQTNFTNYKHSFEAIKLNQFEIEQFKFPPVDFGILVECVSSIENETILYNKRIYRGDRCVIDFDISLKNRDLCIIDTNIKI